MPLLKASDRCQQVLVVGPAAVRPRQLAGDGKTGAQDRDTPIGSARLERRPRRNARPATGRDDRRLRSERLPQAAVDEVRRPQLIDRRRGCGPGRGDGGKKGLERQCPGARVDVPAGVERDRADLAETYVVDQPGQRVGQHDLQVGVALGAGGG